MFEPRVVFKSAKVHLSKEYFKILYLYPAFNDTFVFLALRGLRSDCVVHVDKNGHILFEYEFAIPMDTLGMLD